MDTTNECFVQLREIRKEISVLKIELYWTKKALIEKMLPWHELADSLTLVPENSATSPTKI